MVSISIWIICKYVSPKKKALGTNWLRAISFEYTWGGEERSPIKKSWGEGVKMKKLGVYMKKSLRGGGSEIVGVLPPPPPPPMYF